MTWLIFSEMVVRDGRRHGEFTNTSGAKQQTMVTKFAETLIVTKTYRRVENGNGAPIGKRIPQIWPN